MSGAGPASGGKVLLVRAEAGGRTGTGHVMRCLALAQAWREARGPSVVALAPGMDALEARLRASRVEVATLPEAAGGRADADALAALARRSGASWIVLDGPRFGTDYQHRMAGWNFRLLVVDDAGAHPEYDADLVLNQNLHAFEGLYPRRAARARLLLGPGHVLLRDEFSRWRGHRRETPAAARRVLVTLGGADAGNHTLAVLRALRSPGAPEVEATVVLGSANPHAAEIEDEAARGGRPVRVVRDAADMPSLMAEADMAVASGGSTVWELAFMGVPALVGVTSPLEERLAEGLRRHALFEVVGRFEEAAPSRLAQALAALAGDPAARRTMTERGRATVDGLGRGRVLEAMMEAEAEGRA